MLNGRVVEASSVILDFKGRTSHVLHSRITISLVFSGYPVNLMGQGSSPVFQVS